MKNSVKNTAANTVSNNIAFMAFGKTMITPEFTPTPKYVGVGLFNVVAVNPDKAKLIEMGYKQENEPSYISTDGGSVKVDVFLKTVADKNNGIDFTTKATFWIKKEKRTNMDGSKMQVIDIYGNTAWVTPAEFQAKATTLMGKNGPYTTNLDSNYRGMYVGEDELINFIKVFRRIPNAKSLVKGSWIENPKLAEKGFTAADCECFFLESEIDAMFKGNFEVVKRALEGCQDLEVKMLVGLKTVTTDDKTKTYQQVYTGKTIYSFVKAYDNVVKELVGANYQLEGNMYKKGNYSYAVCDLKEYSVNATDFSKTENVPFPEAAPAAQSWNFAD